jgi:toxin ParE1/3/4
MTASYTLRKLAEKDLEQIWLYTFHEWGIEQADKYIHNLLSRISWLSKNPQLGKQRNDIKPGYYCFPEGRHLIFYTLAKSAIQVIGIPHQSMDIIGHIG